MTDFVSTPASVEMTLASSSGVTHVLAKPPSVAIVIGVPAPAFAGPVDASYDPTAATVIAKGVDVYVMRASGNQGDRSDATGSTAVTPASWPTGAGTLLLASQTSNPVSRPSWLITHLIFGARGLMSQDASYLSNLRLDATGGGGSYPLSPMFPIKTPYVGTAGYPEEVREARSAPVTTKPAGGAWTWADVEALVALEVRADYSNISTAGHFAEGRVTEMYIEAWGPQGSNNPDIVMVHRVARTITMDFGLQVSPLGG